MSVIFILILVSLIVASGFLLAFLWAVKDGQYEDDYSPAVRMLFDEEISQKQNTKSTATESVPQKKELNPVNT